MPTTVNDWLACLDLPEYIAAIPAGKLMPLGQATIWIDGNGKQYSRDEYMKGHNGADPEVIWQAKKEYLKQHGGGVHVG
jgi:hypothetical protein